MGVGGQHRGRLTITESLDGDTAVLHLSGELDLTSVPLLDDAVDSVPSGPGVVVLDLTDLTFVDSSGIGAFVRVTRDRREHGGEVTLRRPQESVLIKLALAGLTTVLDLDLE